MLKCEIKHLLVYILVDVLFYYFITYKKHCIYCQKYTMPDKKSSNSEANTKDNNSRLIKPVKPDSSPHHMLIDSNGECTGETVETKPPSSKMRNGHCGTHTLEVEHGDFEEEVDLLGASFKNLGSRPPTTQNHSAHASSASGSRFRDTWSSIAPTLKVLSPDEIEEQEMQDLEIEDFGSGSGSDLTDDDGEEDDEMDEEEIAEYLNTLHLPSAQPRQLTSGDSSLFQVIEPGKLDKESTVASSHADWEQESLVNTARQISMLENEADSDMNSEEENEIMKEIRAEITNQVRHEMKDELALMKKHIESNSGANKIAEDEDLQHLEPDLKAAILKVRKLDRILAKKIKREKEVKRERILLQRRLKKELEEIKPEGREEIKEAQINTSKFLALTLPTRHNAGIRVRDDGEIEEEPSPPVTPLFTTQVPEELDQRSKKVRHVNAQGEEELRPSSQASQETRDSSNSQATGTTSGLSRNGKKRGKKKKRKDFIKRNKELASDAANLIAMTEEEKARLGNLLGDLDDVPESFLSEEQVATASSSNPYQITLSSGEGFHPTLDERKRLDAIDKRLQSLLSKSDYDSIASTPMPAAARVTSQQSILTEIDPKNVDFERFGERALRETKEDRDLYQRLKDIEYELNHITDRYEPQTETPTLTKEALDALLDDCVRSMSMASGLEPETPDIGSTDRTESSEASRASLVSNPPRLHDDVLQSLLASARREICGFAITQGEQSPYNEGDIQLDSVTATPVNRSLAASRAESLIPKGLEQDTPSSERSSQVPASPTNQIAPRHSSQTPEATNTERALSRNNSASTKSGNNVALNEASSKDNSLTQGLILTNGKAENDVASHSDTVLHNHVSLSRPTTGDSRTSSRPSSSSSIVVDRKPFLPQIDPSGQMSTQKQSSTREALPTSSTSFSTSKGALSGTPLLAKTVWASFSENDVVGDSIDTTEGGSTQSTPVPHPPTSGRRSKNNKRQHRSDSPSMKR